MCQISDFQYTPFEQILVGCCCRKSTSTPSQKNYLDPLRRLILVFLRQLFYTILDNCNSQSQHERRRDRCSDPEFKLHNHIDYARQQSCFSGLDSQPTQYQKNNTWVFRVDQTRALAGSNYIKHPNIDMFIQYFYPQCL